MSETSEQDNPQFVTESEARQIMADVEAGGAEIGYPMICTDLIEDEMVPIPEDARSAGEKFYSCTINGQVGHNLGLIQQSMVNNPTTWAYKLKDELKYA